MGIGGCITVAMVMAMMGGPPQRSLLSGSLSHKSNYKLKKTRRLIGLVRKVAVIATRDPEHPEEIKERAHQPIEKCRACKNCRQRQKVHNDKADLRL
jgi:hypothetical protein